MIYVGTCGFSYKDWVGSFYPGGIKAAEMLPYYVRCFGAVEIESSYYGVPDERTVARMDRCTPPEFRFCFKAPATVTHLPDVAAVIHSDAKLLVRNITPLAEAGKLGCVLLQFPNGFRRSPQAETYLSQAVEALRPLPVVVEFRNREWQNSNGLKLVAQLGAGWCNVDMPNYESLLHPSSDVTSGVGYVRFHGRNANQWWTGTNVTRYDYLYTPAELEPWTARVAEIEDAAGTTYAFFNNHARGNAPRNAELFVELLRTRFGDGPSRVALRNGVPVQSALFDKLDQR